MEDTEDAFIIHGGNKLEGKVSISGAKNVALKTMIAALLFDGKVVLNNIPVINDVKELLRLINSLGARAKFIDRNIVEIDSSTVDKNKVDLLHASKTRVSFMLFAPLLQKFKECFVPNPGGCRIGSRPIDRIIDGMRELGVKVQYDSESGYYQSNISHEGIQGEYTFEKPSHTGTELLLMLSVVGRNNVVLHNVALEPEVDELIDFLNEGGASINKVDTTIIVQGVGKLSQKKEFTISSDRNEAVTFAALAIATKGNIEVKNVNPIAIKTFVDTLKKAGGGIEVASDKAMRFYYDNELIATSIETSPHPGFMTDWQPNWAVLMTQARGESVIHERVFENRFAYVSELRKLGAKIDFISPDVGDPDSHYYFNYDVSQSYKQAIKIHGPTNLHNGVLTIADLRAGASVVIAALVARGESVVNGAPILERGYENFTGKITMLGGNITKI